ncbi:MAG: multidrug efflux RND transporter permease subunit [Gammaproteobacteria bacterium]|nr:multidrug efflux RND transporter permease subunit [Gammaproteobacteria bacterium]MDP2141824.1 multidrug efflux RND transporter permease subunit [Gammaproteobacteria bacterium]MDP2348315.1 multidrug efflux RND transporter permease subunit [Gammaproteobacteria bacterium]
MNFSRFFIDRPIFASVLSLMILLGGLIAMFKLPITEYPEVVPPSIVVYAQFPGANPAVIAETVSTPLEEQIAGVENLLYMFSQANTDGMMTLTLTFAIGTDPDLAQQQVQNRVSQALPRLPEVTRQLGVTTIKASPNMTMVVHLRSPDERYDMLWLRNYALLNIKDQLARVQGVAEVQMFGAGDYAMRLWLKPDEIAELGLTASDVINTVRNQNVQVAAGLIGSAPNPSPLEVQLPVNTKGRLESVEEFENIIIATSPTGAITRLRDVARIELGASQYALRSLLDNEQAVALPILQAPGANAIQISDNVRARMEELKAGFPEGVDYSVVYDPTVFVRESIEAVVKTLLEAIALVVVVVILFLQNWRSSLIPLLAVPVSIIGTFGLMYAFGFSINVLSLFGLVLAIGIVVDDAIVVVENVERNIDNGLSPREATYQAMREVSGPIIAISLTLIAVFVPIAFISGLNGQFYKQFALTIAISTVISAFNSLTLSPALSALLLKSREQREHDKANASDNFLSRGISRFFGLFNRGFSRASDNYSSTVGRLLGRRTATLAVYGVLLMLTWAGLDSTPKGFIPTQDKQYLIGFAQLPAGATLDRTEAVIREMSALALEEEGVESSVAFPGLSINGFTNSASEGIVFVTLDHFDDRHRDDLSADAITNRLQQKFNGVEEAFIQIFPPPPIFGLGAIGGFRLQIQDRRDQGYDALNDVIGQVVQKAWATPELFGVFSSYQINSPQLFADLDRDRAVQLGLSIPEIFSTMQVYLGSSYVNDFNMFGRTYQVVAQADSQYRDSPDDIAQLQMRNRAGNMVPLGAVMNVRESYGPTTAQRYNGFRAGDINGGPAPGYSSGDAQLVMEGILEETLPPGFTYEWTDLTYQEILAGNTALLIFPLCLLLVYLVLAAQYESLTLPLAVIMIVPLSVLAALIGVWMTGGDINIFTQISLFVLIGLASKNAILIVEFARELEHKGMGIREAAVEASRLRLRPILMTSLAFVMGVLPMVLSTGAGAEMRNIMGIAVFSGMIGVTMFGLLLTPVFYVVLRSAEERRRNRKAERRSTDNAAATQTTLSAGQV